MMAFEYWSSTVLTKIKTVRGTCCSPDLSPCALLCTILPRFLPLSRVLAHGFWWAAPGTRPAKCFGFQNEMSKWMRYLNLQHPPTRKKKTKSWLGARTRTSVRVLWALPNPWIFSACAIANSSWVRSPWSHCSCTDAGTCILPALVLPHSLFNRIYNACWLNSCRRKNS